MLHSAAEINLALQPTLGFAFYVPQQCRMAPPPSPAAQTSGGSFQKDLEAGTGTRSGPQVFDGRGVHFPASLTYAKDKSLSYLSSPNVTK